MVEITAHAALCMRRAVRTPLSANVEDGGSGRHPGRAGGRAVCSVAVPEERWPLDLRPSLEPTGRASSCSLSRTPAERGRPRWRTGPIREGWSRTRRRAARTSRGSSVGIAWPRQLAPTAPRMLPRRSVSRSGVRPQRMTGRTSVDARTAMRALRLAQNVHGCERAFSSRASASRRGAQPAGSIRRMLDLRDPARACRRSRVCTRGARAVRRLTSANASARPAASSAAARSSGTAEVAAVTQPPRVGLGPFDLGQAGRPHPARGDQRLDLLAVDLRPRACGRRGAKRCTNQSSSMRFERPSIQPKHSATRRRRPSRATRHRGFLAIGRDLVGVGAVGLQPGWLIGGREESASVPPRSTARRSVLLSAAFRPLLATGDNLDQRQRRGALRKSA